jgi:hypothetical protein
MLMMLRVQLLEYSTDEEGLMAGALTRHEASDRICSTITIHISLVRNEHPVAMHLGGVRVRRVGHLILVPIKSPPSCVICAHKLIVSLISGYMICHAVG